MYYDDYKYKLTGVFLDDRETIARALDDPNLSFEQKEALVSEHNFRNIDSLSTDTYTNRICYNVVNENPVYYTPPVVETEYTYSDSYISDFQSSTSSDLPKVYDVSFSDGHLLFDDKKA